MHYIAQFIILCILFSSNVGFGQLKKINYNAKKVNQIEQWEVLDLTFTLKSSVKSPYTTNFYAVFTHEDGTNQEIPGFYNGGTEWIIRFSSSLQGDWTFETMGDLKKLADKKGKVKVTPPKEDNHGAIVLNSKNAQHFYYEDGTPYFLLAFECDWLYALDYENDKAIPKTEHLLNLIDQNGFNQIVMNVFSYDVRWEKDEKLKEHPEHDFGAPEKTFPFLGTNKNPDFSALNPEFFQKFDRTISRMHDKHIVSHLMIYVWNKLVNWPDMNTEADNMYFDYIIKRYQAFPNIVWDISKEALYYGRADEAYIHGRIQRIRDQDKFQRLLSVHDFKYCSRFPEKVDFISTQNWSHNLYNKMLDTRTKFNKKPVFNIEHGGYEESPYVVFTGDYTDAAICLRRNYMCLFAGVYSTYYWQGASWNVAIWNPFEQPENFIKPKFNYFQHMTKLFSLYDFSKMKPTPWKNGSSYSLTNDKETVLLYIHKENYGIDAAFLKDKKQHRTFQWFNTLTGEFSKDAPITATTKKFISPWRNEADSILISKLIN